MPKSSQQVILYDVDSVTHVFDTAYDDSQARKAVIACANRHGTFSNVRAIPARDFWQQPAD